MDRHGKTPLAVVRDGGEHAGEEALHVGSAAAIEPAVALGDGEGFGRPALPVDRNHVGVAGQRDAGDASRPDGGVEAGLLPVGRRHDLADDAVLEQVVLDETDQRHVRLVARRVEADEARQQLRRGVARSLHRGLASGPLPKFANVDARVPSELRKQGATRIVALLV